MPICQVEGGSVPAPLRYTVISCCMPSDIREAHAWAGYASIAMRGVACSAYSNCPNFQRTVAARCFKSRTS